MYWPSVAPAKNDDSLVRRTPFLNLQMELGYSGQTEQLKFPSGRHLRRTFVQLLYREGGKVTSFISILKYPPKMKLCHSLPRNLSSPISFLRATS